VSADADHDLTGRWSGIFNYPDLSPPNAFEAELRDAGGLLSGLTTEQDDNPCRNGGPLHAVIEGHRQASNVRFTKHYDDFNLMPDVVVYTGVVHPGGDEIDGRWEVPGSWSGTFLMVRNGGRGDELAYEASEAVGLPAA
jgi:hypothetical protein